MMAKLTSNRELYRPIIRLAAGLIILLIVNWILVSLPMIKQLVIPGLPISGSGIVSLIIGIIMIYLFLGFRREFVPKVQATWPTYPEIEPIAHSAVNLVIIVVAYVMFDGFILPLMAGFRWLYSVIFLLIAIQPLYNLVMRLYRSSGIITDLITGKVAGVSGESVKCHECGEKNPSTTKFCSQCGAGLALPATEVLAIKCSNCGTEYEPSDRFCSNCGKPVIKKGELMPSEKEPEKVIDMVASEKRSIQEELDTLRAKLAAGELTSAEYDVTRTALNKRLLNIERQLEPSPHRAAASSPVDMPAVVKPEPVVDLVNERDRVATWLQNLDAKKGDFSEEVYAKVKRDYETRLAAAKTSLDATVGDLQRLLGYHKQQREQTSIELEDLEVRHAAGEIDDEYHKTQKADLQSRIKRATRESTKVKKLLDQIG